MSSVIEDMSYYLRKHLEDKLNLNSTVAEDLPEEVCINSTGRPSSRLSLRSSTSTKHKGDKIEVINILHDIQAGRQPKREEEHRSMKHFFEAQWKAKEEACREKEEEDNDREEEQKAHNNLFNEWECIQMNI